MSEYVVFVSTSHFGSVVEGGQKGRGGGDSLGLSLIMNMVETECESKTDPNHKSEPNHLCTHVETCLCAHVELICVHMVNCFVRIR